MRPALVLVHSPSVGPRTWEPVASRLNALGWDVAVPSLLHIAEGQPPFWPQVAGAVASAVQEFEPGRPVILVPHSNAGFFIPVIMAALQGAASERLPVPEGSATGEVAEAYRKSSQPDEPAPAGGTAADPDTTACAGRAAPKDGAAANDRAAPKDRAASAGTPTSEGPGVRENPIAGCIFVDAAVPPSSGETQVVPPGALPFLRGMASDGLLPPWTDWWDEADVAPLFPDRPGRQSPQRNLDCRLRTSSRWCRRSDAGKTDRVPTCSSADRTTPTPPKHASADGPWSTFLVSICTCWSTLVVSRNCSRFWRRMAV